MRKERTESAAAFAQADQAGQQMALLGQGVDTAARAKDIPEIPGLLQAIQAGATA